MTLSPHARLKACQVQPSAQSEADVVLAIDASDVIVVPRTRPGTSDVAALALARGRPLVITPVEGLVGLVRQNENGVIAAATSPVALADALARLVDEPELCQVLSAGALASRRGEGGWAHAAPQFGAMIEHLNAWRNTAIASLALDHGGGARTY
ncbi:MAG: glycosyltransferase [Hyphomicrobiaceae bacterium]